MEKFVRGKVKRGDYETASEVVREGLRLLRHRDEAWENEIRAKIDQGLGSLEQGNGLSEKQVKSAMTKYKGIWRRARKDGR